MRDGFAHLRYGDNAPRFVEERRKRRDAELARREEERQRRDELAARILVSPGHTILNESEYAAAKARLDAAAQQLGIEEEPKAEEAPTKMGGLDLIRFVPEEEIERYLEEEGDDA